jgi:signal peptidase I
MRQADGVGLAAPQVGILRRVVVIETPDEGLIELINPKIIAYSGEQESEEGCLSVPGRWGITRRPMHVTVRAMNRNGETFELEEPYRYLSKDGSLMTSSHSYPYTVPEGELFVMGDNRAESADSRLFGAIPKDKIEGNVVCRIWPLNKIGKLD